MWNWRGVDTHPPGVSFVPGRPKQNMLLAAALIIFAEVLFAAMGATVKALSAELPNASLVFFRNFFALLILLPFMLHGGRAMVVTRHPGLHVLRGVVGVAAMSCFFYALAHIQLAEAVLLKLTAPLFIPLIALFWLREPVDLKVGIAVIVGFLGVGLILKPGFAAVPPVALVGLLGGALAGLAQTTVRRMADTEPGLRIVVYFSFIATLVSALPLFWAWVTPAPPLWGMLVLLGALGTLGQLLMTRAYALASAARVGVFGYTSVLFASGFGWLLWNEAMDALAWAGAGLIVLAGIFATQRRRMEDSETPTTRPQTLSPMKLPVTGPTPKALPGERPAD